MFQYLISTPLVFMEHDILALIRKNNGVSFVDLSQNIMNFPGEFAMVTPNEGYILWGGCSMNAANALNNLLETKQIHLQAATEKDYTLKEANQEAYIIEALIAPKTLQWLPSVVCLGKPPIV